MAIRRRPTTSQVRSWRLADTEESQCTASMDDPVGRFRCELHTDLHGDWHMAGEVQWPLAVWWLRLDTTGDTIEVLAS